MSGIETWMIIGAAMVAPTLWAAARKLRERRRTRARLRETPAFEATIDEGTPVRITGTVAVLSETLTAPLSGRACVAFRARIYIVTDFTAPKPRETSRAVEFVLEREGEAAVTVDSEHVLFDLPPLEVDAVEAFADLHALTPKERTQAKYEEVVVGAGMRVSVAGTLMKDVARTAPTVELGFRGEAPPALRLVGNAEHPIIIGAAL